MVNILDIISEQKSKAKYYKSKDDAWDHFVKQKDSIEAISGTQGFKEIKEYRSREAVACQERLQTVRSEDIKWVQAELRTSMKFLDFLENLKNSDTSSFTEEL